MFGKVLWGLQGVIYNSAHLGNSRKDTSFALGSD